MLRRPTVSPTELNFKRLLDFYFGGLKKIDNFRPPWLNGLEIDRYYPEIKVGVEFQGIQHYRPTAQLRQDREGFLDQVRRDTEKISLAAKQGIKIFAFGLQEITPQRFKYHLKMLADTGLRVAEAEGNKRVVDILKGIRWDRNPDPAVFKRFEGVKRSKRWRARPPKKHSLLQRILRG